jgi:hypothetical protein
MMNRSLLALLLTGVLASVATSASAEEGKTRPTFPISASEFQARQDARVVKMRAKLEERISAKKLDAEEAKAKRAKFEVRIASVQAAIDKAKADGTVTKDEAKEIRKLAHAGRGKHGHHAEKKEEKK